jgi:hypothetical protein
MHTNNGLSLLLPLKTIGYSVFLNSSKWHVKKMAKNTVKIIIKEHKSATQSLAIIRSVMSLVPEAN